MKLKKMNVTKSVISYFDCKKYYFITLLLLLALFLLYFYILRQYNVQENFLGAKAKKKSDEDDNDESEPGKKNYSHFPPTSKYDLLNDIFGKNQPGRDNNQTKNSDEKKGVKEIPISNVQIQSKPTPELEKSDLQKSVSKLDDAKALLGKCSFFPNKCPNGMSSVTSLSGSNMKCGSKGESEESRVAKAVAEIQSGHLSRIILIDGGSGYTQENPPKVSIVSNGSSGSGGSAKAEVGSDGTLRSIDIVDYGYQYVETPKVVVEAPQMSGVCHLCC